MGRRTNALEPGIADSGSLDPSFPGTCEEFDPLRSDEGISFLPLSDRSSLLLAHEICFSGRELNISPDLLIWTSTYSVPSACCLTEVESGRSGPYIGLDS
jgi:hypothetical protein